MAIFAPLVLFLTVGAYPLLRFLFGTEYAENGDLVMRLLAPGLLPSAFLSLAVAFARVKRQVGRLLFLSVDLFARSAFRFRLALVSWLRDRWGGCRVADLADGGGGHSGWQYGHWGCLRVERRRR